MAELGRRVLLVDDDDVRRAVCEVLTDEGYEVKEADNGREAMAVLGGAGTACEVVAGSVGRGFSL